MTAGLILVLLAGILGASGETDSPGKHESQAGWPQWRGPLGTGYAPNADPPVEWSESKNIRWKVKIPGHGHASPIVWGDRVYVQTAIKTDQTAAAPDAQKDSTAEMGRRMRGWLGTSSNPTNIYEFSVLAFDRKSGKTVWQRKLLAEVPHEGAHETGSLASNSPVTDGEHLIAYFGSRGMYCLDLEGKVLWEKDLGEMRIRMGFGEGSSPALFGDTVVVNWDHEGQSFIAAFDKRTGSERWRVERDEPTTWATPLVVSPQGKPQVVTSATNQIRSYDLHTGKVLWTCGGMTANVVPSPPADDELIYFGSGFRGSALLAVRYGAAQGDVTDTPALAWEYAGKGTPYVPSLLLCEGSLYFLSGNKAVLSCVNAKTGKAHYDRQRLEGLGDVFASPVGAPGRVYVADRDGKFAVIQPGPEFKLLAVNTLDEGCSATPALVGKEIYLRGREHLYCIAAP